MEAKSNISSSRHTEFNSRFEVANNICDIVTEDLGIKKCKIITRIYLKGEIISTVTIDYAHIAHRRDLKDKIRVMMEKQHKSARETFISERSKPKKSKARFALGIKESLTLGNNKSALVLVREALASFPSDPFFLSYHGFLTAVVENRSSEGTMLCNEAIRILRTSKSIDLAFFLPLFYLHLGRASLVGNRKRAALEAFQDGLKFDSKNHELLSEIKRLGVRKKPVVSFLDRNHPLNKYLGMFRFKLQNSLAT